MTNDEEAVVVLRDVVATTYRLSWLMATNKPGEIGARKELIRAIKKAFVATAGRKPTDHDIEQILD